MREQAAATRSVCFYFTHEPIIIPSRRLQSAAFFTVVDFDVPTDIPLSVNRAVPLRRYEVCVASLFMALKCS